MTAEYYLRRKRAEIKTKSRIKAQLLKMIGWKLKYTLRFDKS